MISPATGAIETSPSLPAPRIRCNRKVSTRSSRLWARAILVKPCSCSSDWKNARRASRPDASILPAARSIFTERVKQGMPSFPASALTKLSSSSDSSPRSPWFRCATATSYPSSRSTRRRAVESAPPDTPASTRFFGVSI